MARKTPLDLLSFRRTFALLVLLVVLPSAGLSGFGVLAIINERAAVEKRLEAAWSGRLQAIAGKLKRVLDTSSATVQREHLQRMLTGLTSDLERKSVEPIAVMHGTLVARRAASSGEATDPGLR